MKVLETFSLNGKTALVTGGAGLYGRQIVDALAEAGAKVFVAARSREALEEFAASRRESGLDVEALTYDQGNEKSILALRDELLSRVDQLDILVNNAVLRSMKEGYQSSAESFAQSMQVNATGLFIITRAFGDKMAEQKSGSIINIGSIQGVCGEDASLYVGTDMVHGSPDYYFHKGGVTNFSRFIASYYGASQVRCNCVIAGGFFNNQPEPFLSRYKERTFLGRMADDADLKGLMVYLASDASRYMTGANIALDGGYTAK